MAPLNRDDPTGWPSFVFHPTDETQTCPSCGAIGPDSPRHSPFICLKCAADVVNEDGDAMIFADMSQCCRKMDDRSLSENWKSHNSRTPFFLKGQAVSVYEGRFGGFVVKYREL